MLGEDLKIVTIIFISGFIGWVFVYVKKKIPRTRQGLLFIILLGASLPFMIIVCVPEAYAYVSHFRGMSRAFALLGLFQLVMIILMIKAWPEASRTMRAYEKERQENRKRKREEKLQADKD